MGGAEHLTRLLWRLLRWFVSAVVLTLALAFVYDVAVSEPREAARQRAATELNRADVTVDVCRASLEPDERGMLNDARDTLDAAHEHYRAARMENAERLAGDAIEKARVVGCDVRELVIP